MVDRRQRKLEKKRKKRQLVRRQTRLARDQHSQRLLASAGRAPFGPCALSSGWDDDAGPPGLVTAVVTRVLGNGSLLPSVVLVDRTCLGVKNGFVADMQAPNEIATWFDEAFSAHGGWDPCTPDVVQSVVFHALDYAARLGFRPHPDAELALFEPRPDELLPTAWHAAARPIYMTGPDDNVAAIITRLTEKVGPDGFDVTHMGEYLDFDRDEAEDGDEEQPVPRLPQDSP